MKKETEQLFVEHFHSLPQSIQNIIHDSGWENKVRGVVKKYNLRIDQGQAVENDTLLVMMGVIKPEEYLQYITDDTGVSLELAEQIVVDLEKEIFEPIRGELMKLTEEEPAVNPEKVFDNPAEEIGITKTEAKIEDEVNLDADSLLKEIEDEGNHLLPAKNHTDTTPINLPSEPIQPAISPTPQTPPTPVKIEEVKMAETQVSQKPAPVPAPTPTPPLDPYREIFE